MVRIVDVKPSNDFHVELKLSTGEIVHRDLRPYLKGAIFKSIREHGTVVWPNGADLCPDVVIWGGLAPADSSSCAA